MAKWRAAGVAVFGVIAGCSGRDADGAASPPAAGTPAPSGYAPLAPFRQPDVTPVGAPAPSSPPDDPPVDGPLPGLTVLADHQAHPSALVVDGGYVYWANAGTSAAQFADGGVWRVAVGGGQPEQLSSSPGKVIALALTPAYAYFAHYDSGMSTGTGTVARVPRAGGAVEVVTSGWEPRALGYDGGSVYFGRCCGITLERIPVDGSAPFFLGAWGYQSCVGAVSAAGGWVYWLGAGEYNGSLAFHLLRAGGDGKPQPLANLADDAGPMSASPPALRIAGGHAYTASSTALFRFELEPGAKRELVVSGAVDALSADDVSLFWTAGAGLWRAPLAGGPKKQLVGGAGALGALDVDATHLAWAEPGAGDLATGRVLMAAK